MAAVATHASDPAMRVLRGPPTRPLSALVLLVTRKQASARTTGSPLLKLKISPGSLPRVSKWRLAGP